MSSDVITPPKQPENKVVTACKRIGTVAGGIVNSLFVFLNTSLGNTGKLLSTLIILFTAMLVGWAFFGQISNIPEVTPGMKGQELINVLNIRRIAFKDAISSVSAPLATLVGVLTTIIGGGLVARRYMNGGRPVATTAVTGRPPVNPGADVTTSTITYK